MKELLVASGNRGKLAEIAEMLHGSVERIYSLSDFPHIPAPLEDGDTFAANAIKKARNAAQATGLPTLADDSGLVVPVLDGRPGVFSARYAGDDADDAANNAKLLAELAEIDNELWHASFCCVMALYLPGGECKTFCGELNGIILAEYRGGGGFGYDPLFLVPEFGKTLAELDMTIKNTISHRGKALVALRSYLESSCGELGRKSLHAD
jgi:XTP/dITP diphosphohydrolase